MDWVDRPQNYKGLYGILQLLQGSHLDNFLLKTLKLGWVAFHSLTFQLKRLDLRSNQYKKLISVLWCFCKWLYTFSNHIVYAQQYAVMKHTQWSGNINKINKPHTQVSKKHPLKFPFVFSSWCLSFCLSSMFVILQGPFCCSKIASSFKHVWNPCDIAATNCTWFTHAILKLQLKRDKNSIVLPRQKLPV